jgi:hypothetical protein
MNGLLNHSNLSFVSSRPPSVISLPTTTSSDAVEGGIGTVSGRVVYAVGEAAIRGLENLAIRRKLKIIDSAFPHGNDVVAMKNMETIYSDILELSRSSFAFSRNVTIADDGPSNIQTWPLSSTSPKASITSTNCSNRNPSDASAPATSCEVAHNRDCSFFVRNYGLYACRMVIKFRSSSFRTDIFYELQATSKHCPK